MSPETIKPTQILMYSVRYFCTLLTKSGVSRYIFTESTQYQILHKKSDNKKNRMIQQGPYRKAEKVLLILFYSLMKPELHLQHICIFIITEYWYSAINTLTLYFIPEF